MGQHHALRQPGRAARVRQHGQVVGRIDVELGRRPRPRRAARRRVGSSPSASPTTKMSLHPGMLGSGPRRVEEGRDREQQLRPGIAELVAELVRGVERVRGRVRRIRPQDAPWKIDRVLGQVRHVDGDDVPLADAPRGERAAPARSTCRPSSAKLIARPLGPSISAGLSPSASARASVNVARSTSGISGAGVLRRRSRSLLQIRNGAGRAYRPPAGGAPTRSAPKRMQTAECRRWEWPCHL